MQKSSRSIWNRILQYIAAACAVASLVLLILRDQDTHGILVLLAITAVTSTFAQLKNK